MEIMVSVIIPVYNVENYIRQCLDSVLNQTLKGIEIICVNDGSTDGSLAILREYERKDDRIIVLDQKNCGAAAARNSGIKIASGEYIGFVDSDDFIDLDFYNTLYLAVKQKNADLARTSYKYHYNENHTERIVEESFNKILKERIDANESLNMNDHNVVIWNALYKREFLLENSIFFDETHLYMNDILFTAKATYFSKKSVPVLGSFYHYRIFEPELNNQHLTVRFRRKIDTFIHVNTQVVDFINSVEYADNNDYIVAYKRCFWRFDDRMRNLSGKINKNDMETMFNAYVSIFKKFRKQNAVEKETYFKFLKGNNFQGYLDSIMKRDIVISLASYPARIGVVNRVIETLLHQSKQADIIVLWLEESAFPKKEEELPPELLELTKRGLLIGWVKENIRSFTKLIPALQKYPDSVIVTADDDILYSSDWLQKLYTAYKTAPEMVHCHRVHKIGLKHGKLIPYNEWRVCVPFSETVPSFLNFLTGVGGVLYPPNIFYKDIFRQDLFTKLTPLNDDVWFWAMLVMNSIKINVVKDNQSKLNIIKGTQTTALWRENVTENKNDVQLVNVIKYYPGLMRKVRSEVRKARIKEIEKFFLRLKNMGAREFFGKVRRKIIRLLFGRQLYNNLFSLDQINENVLRLTADLNVNMARVNQLFSRVENQLKQNNENIGNVTRTVEQNTKDLTDKTLTLPHKPQ